MLTADQRATGTSISLVADHVNYAVYGAVLVDEVTLAVEPGTLTALVGPNGAGKSTLLKLLAGDLRPTGGTVLLDGVSLTSFSARDQARRRAVMAQSTTVSAAFTSFEIALMGRNPHLGDRRESAADRDLAYQALERVDAAMLAQRLVQTLSGGEAARVQLARALTQATPILLLDEPTAALDLRHQHSVLQLARTFAAEGGAVLAVLHDLNLAAAYATSIALISHGRLVAHGLPWDVLTADRIEAVYGVPVLVAPHPVTGAPTIAVC